MTDPTTPQAWAALEDTEQAAILRIECAELPTVETLETRHSDRLDFHCVSVGSLRQALALAYLMGAGRWQPGATTVKRRRKSRT